MSSDANSRYLLRNLLRDVSRSFYLTLRVLPAPIRDQIGLAYLLARATDTIADSDLIAINERLSALSELRNAILSDTPAPVRFEQLQSNQPNPSERILLSRINVALALLSTFGAEDRTLIQAVLRTITEGQILDLQRFGAGSAQNIMALQNSEELDDYTYKVAGCVGEFWTRICCSHLTPEPKASLDVLIKKGVRFGQGLQLVNILRDIPRDLRSGRCYLPQSELNLARLSPSDLLDPKNEVRLRPLYNEWLLNSENHLAAGWSYVLDLPPSWIRVRLGCSWPILIGFKTLHMLRSGNVLDPEQRIKISRAEVRRILRKSVTGYFFRSWSALPEKI